MGKGCLARAAAPTSSGREGERGGGGGGSSLGSLARSNSRGWNHPLFPGRAVPFPEGTREGAEVPAGGAGRRAAPGAGGRWSLLARERGEAKPLAPQPPLSPRHLPALSAGLRRAAQARSAAVSVAAEPGPGASQAGRRARGEGVGPARRSAGELEGQKRRRPPPCACGQGCATPPPALGRLGRRLAAAPGLAGRAPGTGECEGGAARAPDCCRGRGRAGAASCGRGQGRPDGALETETLPSFSGGMARPSPIPKAVPTLRRAPRPRLASVPRCFFSEWCLWGRDLGLLASRRARMGPVRGARVEKPGPDGSCAASLGRGPPSVPRWPSGLAGWRGDPPAAHPLPAPGVTTFRLLSPQPV